MERDGKGSLNETFSEEAHKFMQHYGEGCKGCIHDGLTPDGEDTKYARTCEIFFRKPDAVMQPTANGFPKCPYYTDDRNVDSTKGKCEQCKKCLYMNTDCEDGYIFDPEEYRLPYCAWSMDVDDYWHNENYSGRAVSWDKATGPRYFGKPFQVITNIKECSHFLLDDDYEDSDA